MRRAAVVAVLMLAAGCTQQRHGHVYRVPSSSMEPTMHCGRPASGCEADENDRVFAVPYEDSEPSRGDIVVFETPPAARIRCGAGGLFIKRVIGLPHEGWRERAGEILLLGDNRGSSCDSRIYGLVPLKNIRGKIVEIKRGSKRIHLR
jgi:signal peptidase I